MALARLAIVVLALLTSFVFGEGLGEYRFRFTAVLLCVALPYALAAVVPRRGLPLDIQLAGDLTVMFLIQLAVPSTRETALIGYTLITAFQTGMRGRVYGLITASVSVLITVATEAIDPGATVVDGFTFVMFSAALFAIAMIIDEATKIQRVVSNKEHDLQFSALSHELRTPLTSIEGFATTLATRWEDLDDATRRDFVERILSNAHDMHRLSEGVLEFSSSPSGKPSGHAVSVDLRDLVQTYVAAHAPALSGHPVHLEIPEAMMVLLGKDSADRIFGNLLSNAVKFSPEGAPISLIAVSLGDEVVVSVRDRGPGITLEQREKIFEPFFQGEGGERRGGAGIGLALVRQHVARNGGRVWVESHPGRGSSFMFTIPKSGVNAP